MQFDRCLPENTLLYRVVAAELALRYLGAQRDDKCWETVSHRHETAPKRAAYQRAGGRGRSSRMGAAHGADAHTLG
jgi:hypothetical protein